MRSQSATSRLHVLRILPLSNVLLHPVEEELDSAVVLAGPLAADFVVGAGALRPRDVFDVRASNNDRGVGAVQIVRKLLLAEFDLELVDDPLAARFVGGV